MQLHPELFSDKPDEGEKAIRTAKWLVMRELRVPLDEKTLIKIACNQISGRGFVGALRKAFASNYGDTEGLSLGDIEVTADYLGVYDDIWPAPNTS